MIHRRLAVVAVGTEVTEGRIANTNAAWISKRFLRLGIDTAFHVAVPDERPLIAAAFQAAAARADLVVVTGGLGPTVDDITRDVAADLAGAPLEEDRGSIERLEAIFRMIGRPVTENNRRQAQFPRGAAIVENDHGTAPGVRLRLCDADFVFVPGVPHESERMLDGKVIPALESERAAAGAPAVVVRRLNCFGLPESKVDALLAPHFPGPDPALAFNISDGVVQVYLTARDADRAAAAARLEAGAAKVREVLGAHLFGEGDASLEETLLSLLRARGLTLALAESCTGGLAASRLVRVPGASHAFRGGVVAYSNDLKRDLLGVPAEMLERHGAVSAEVAAAMAAGVRRAAGASIGAAVTGIAGPDGGTAEKPVGLVHLAVATEAGPGLARQLRLGGERSFIQRIAALGALELVRRTVLGIGAGGSGGGGRSGEGRGHHDAAGPRPG